MAAQVTITEDQDGQRLDRLLRQLFPNLAYGQTQKLIRSGQIRLDGKRAKSETRVSQGQIMRLPPHIEQIQKPKLTGQDAVKPMIVFEDAHLLVLNKPAGLATQGGSKTTKHIDGMLAGYADPKPRLVHRLDKDTSGILVTAKSAQAARTLARQFQGRDVEKTYLAVVCGVPEKREGRIDAPLLKAGGKGEEKMVFDGEKGDRAITEYEVIDQMGQDISLIRFFPETGRTHQIRAHAALIDCPILGDRKYNEKEVMFAGFDFNPGMHLHALQISFTHPATGKPVQFECPPPKEWRKTLQSFGLELTQI